MRRRSSRWRSCCGSSVSPSNPIRAPCSPRCPTTALRSGPSGSSAPGSRSRSVTRTPTTAAAATAAEYAVEITYEGLYELVEETLADGSSSILDDHFGVLGGWIASTLVKLGDLRLAFLPADDVETE